MEYLGAIAILDILEKLGMQQEPITIRGDSKLVIKQMNKEWRIKEGAYVPYAKRCLAKSLRFPKIRFEWIPREENGLADELSKGELRKVGVKFRIQPE
jgi:ribonuclease HI